MSIRRDGRRQVIDEGPHGALDMTAALKPVEKVGNQMVANVTPRGKGFQISTAEGKGMNGVWEASGNPTPGQVDWAKPILAAALEKGLFETWVGAVFWRFRPISTLVQPCGHPLAARKVTHIGGGLQTTCWACEVQEEIDRGPTPQHG